MAASTIVKKIFQKTPKTRFAFFLIADIVSIVVAVWLAFFLRFEGNLEPHHIAAMQRLMILALVFSLPLFYFFRLYSFSWSYVGTNELVSLLKAVSVSLIFVGGAIFFSQQYEAFVRFPRSTLILSYIFIFLFAGGVRLSKRIYQEFTARRKDGTGKDRTLIVGAGDEGEQIVRSLLQSKKSTYSPVGFVDDSEFKKGNRIHGILVWGNIDDIERIVRENEIEAVIIALPVERSADIRRATEKAQKAGVQKLKVAPPMTDLINDESIVRNLRDVQVEDLLGREPVSLDEEAIRKFIEGKKVFVTGAAGSIGSELCRQIARFQPQSLCILDRDETGIFTILRELKRRFPQLLILSYLADIQDRKKIYQVFDSARPDIVFHAAAYKHVPLMQEHADEAVKNNILGTEIVAEASVHYGVEKFVFISTDKAVNPSSVMGMTKRIGEMVCQMYNQKGITKFISVRFGNVLESRGSVIPIFREQIRRGGPVEVTHPEMKRYFMMNSEACLLVMQAGAMGSGGEVFVLDMGDPVLIVDLAKEMIRLSGFDPDTEIPIVFTGMRPGEKLFEDFLTAEEGTVATHYEKIFIAKLQNVDEISIIQSLASIKEKVQIATNEELVEILSAMYKFS